MPEETFDALREFLIGIKGPLTTPVGGGFRSLNVTLRQVLDLYSCVRPVRWYRGVPSPVKHPEEVDVVIFRENTEDVYAGIEYESGTPENEKLAKFLREELGANFFEGAGIGIKPISAFGTKRLVRAAIRYAIDHGRKSVTLVHKGNIQKFTEGAFTKWGYEVAAQEFPEQTISWADVEKNHGGKVPAGKILIQDVIADISFQKMLLRPSEFDVLATPNLNGDYLSDAIAAEVGGVGIAPGANIGDEVALFEATHGTAPKYTDLDKVNPGSLLFSGVMMLEHIGWQEAADLITKGLREDARPEDRDLRLRPPDGRREGSQDQRIRHRHHRQHGLSCVSQWPEKDHLATGASFSLCPEYYENVIMRRFGHISPPSTLSWRCSCKSNLLWPIHPTLIILHASEKNRHNVYSHMLTSPYLTTLWAWSKALIRRRLAQNGRIHDEQDFTTLHAQRRARSSAAARS